MFKNNRSSNEGKCQDPNIKYKRIIIPPPNILRYSQSQKGYHCFDPETAKHVVSAYVSM